MKFAGDFTGGPAADAETAALITALSGLGSADGSTNTPPTDWGEPLHRGNIVLPVLTRDAVRDHLVKMICCHSNRNVRDVAESYLEFEIAEFADLLIELGEISPTFRDAVLLLNIAEIEGIAAELRWKEPVFFRHYDEREIIAYTRVLDRFLQIQDAAVAAGEAVRKINQFAPPADPDGVSPAVGFAIKCTTLTRSIYLPITEWGKAPSWVTKRKNNDNRFLKHRFDQIFMFYRGIFIRDHALATLDVPEEHAPEWVARISNLPEDGTSPAKEIILAMRKRAKEGRFEDDFWRDFKSD